ncbi:30S ribosomal protein S3 [Candidatus Woesearchaeota archaeon]|nr:30S ribosomal protein S3 [Candidatus Woesearchaeota archaeon]
MIERQIIAEKVKEKQIQDFVFSFLGATSCSYIAMQRTPLGEKISVYTSRPGLIVGRKGANIKKLTDILKTKFNMENPQLEVLEIPNPLVDASSVSRSLITGFDRFGPKRFKAMAYKALEDAMRAGAKGIEIVISGRGVPGERAKTWRFSAGYLKKSGDVSENYMDRSYESCNLRSGTIGIKVSILHSEVVLPDDIKIREDQIKVVSTPVSEQDIIVQAKKSSEVLDQPKPVVEEKSVDVKEEIKTTEVETGEKPKKRTKKKTKEVKQEVENGETKEE